MSRSNGKVDSLSHWLLKEMTGLAGVGTLSACVAWRQ